jgi:hypothetical protein
VNAGEQTLSLLAAFRRRTAPIATGPALADFIDSNAAFLVQKGLYEYSRARAGHYAKILFAEAGFREAIERSRWRAFPLGLAMVTEMVEGVLREYAEDRRATLDSLSALALSVFDRYPVPAVLDPLRWAEARKELAQRLDLVGMHAVKPAKDIPVPFAEAYFALMPIHEKLRTSEFPTITSYLRVSMCNIHDEFANRMDPLALVRALSSS